MSLSIAFKDSFFQVVSFMTSTGFLTTNYDLWPELSKLILFILMFIGACAGSTGGGVKVSRWVIIFKKLKKASKKKQLENKEDAEAFRDQFDWYQITDQNTEVWDKIFAFLKA